MQVLLRFCDEWLAEMIALSHHLCCFDALPGTVEDWRYYRTVSKYGGCGFELKRVVIMCTTDFTKCY